MSRSRLALAGLSAAWLSCSGSYVLAQESARITPVQPPSAALPLVVASPCTEAPEAAASALPDFCRTKLTGDWGGYRTELASHGITLDASLTQFYQGVTHGGKDQEFFYGGRLDYLLNIDGEKAGLMKGSFITLHAETLYGQSANGAAGTVFPVSVGQLLPAPDPTITALTGIKYTQFLSKNFALFGGKINTLDEDAQAYAGGRGVDAFMNTSFALPLVVARTVPYSTWGGGFAVLNDSHEVIFSAAAVDTNNSSTTTGLNTFFNNGVTLMAQATLPVSFNGLHGHQGVGGTYSTGRYRSLDRNAYFDPNDGSLITSPEEKGSWSVYYLFDQALMADGCNPQRTWGIFGNLGIADNNPSPIRWAGNIGFGGASLATCREHDSWGVGYFYNGLTNNVKDLAGRLLQLGDEQGIEAFYNVGVTPWCHLTPDVQIVLPGRERFDTAVVFGLRMKIDF